MADKAKAAYSTSIPASSKTIGEMLESLKDWSEASDLWEALREINYQGLDPYVVMRALIIAYKVSIKAKPAEYKKLHEEALVNKDFDLSLNAEQMREHISHILELITFAAKLGNNTKKVEKIPVNRREGMKALFARYHVVNADNKVPDSSVITLTRIMAVHPVIISVLLVKNVMKPIVTVKKLPLALHHPQAWAVMSETERKTYLEPYKEYVLKFSKLINRKNGALKDKEDSVIMDEQWPFVELQVNEFSDEFSEKWLEIYTALTGKKSYKD